MALISSRRVSSWLYGGVTVAVLYLGHVFYGGNTYASGLVLTAAMSALLLGLAAAPRGRELLAETRIPALTGVLFLLVFVAASWALTPYTPGGPHPIWTVAGQRGASTLDVTATAIELVKLLGLACIFVVGAALGGDREQERRVRELLLWGGAAFAFYALVAFLTRTQAAPGDRLAANFMSANSAATVFGMLTVLAAARLQTVGWFSGGRGSALPLLSPQTISHLGLTLLFLTVVVLTGSRGGLAATLLGLLALAILKLWRGQLGLRAVLAFGALAAVLSLGVLLSKGEATLERLEATDLNSEERVVMLAEHWDAFLRSPVNGYGLGSFPAVNQLMLTNDNHDSMWNLGAVHNVYLQWLEEGGLAAAAPMFLLIAAIVIATLLGLERRRRSVEWIQGLLAVNVVVLAHGMTDYALQVPSIAALWSFLLGVQLGAARRA